MGEEDGPMHASHERPFGVSVIAVLLAIKGLASLTMALGPFTFQMRRYR